MRRRDGLHGVGAANGFQAPASDRPKKQNLALLDQVFDNAGDLFHRRTLGIDAVLSIKGRCKPCRAALQAAAFDRAAVICTGFIEFNPDNARKNLEEDSARQSRFPWA